MNKIILELDYLLYPISDCDINDGELFTDVDVINKDEIIRKINLEIGTKYSSYYEFDSHDQPCWFNIEQAKKDKNMLLDLTKKLVDRLNEINDGSYEVIDNITNYLERVLK